MKYLFRYEYIYKQVTTYRFYGEHEMKINNIIVTNQFEKGYYQWHM